MNPTGDQDPSRSGPRWSDFQTELHRVAQRVFRGQPAAHSLQPTALLNEAWLRISERDPLVVNDRTHLLALAARVMRQILVDHARQKAASKRGARASHGEETVSGIGRRDQQLDLVELDDVLHRLATSAPRQARVVELRVFAGLTIEEVSAELGISHMTVSADWKAAKQWIGRELRRSS